MIRFIDDLDIYTPKNEYSDFIKNYYSKLKCEGTKKFIENVDVEVKIIEIHDTLIPITFGSDSIDCCPTSSVLGIFEYLKVEAQKIQPQWFGLLLRLFAESILFISTRIKLYNIIFVNNLLLTTNIYPTLPKGSIEVITHFLQKHYPEKGIIVRSINEMHKDYICELESIEYKRVIFRQVYLSYKSKRDTYKKIKEVKSDKKQFEDGKYKKIQKNNFTIHELREIKLCYDNLYIHKYSKFNPRFTIDFFEHIQKNPYFSLNILTDLQDNIDGVYGYFCINQQITAPIFGYQHHNTYRLLTHAYTQEALEKACILNWSSGVGKFKVNRGGEKVTEYFFVLSKHLVWTQRIAWSFIHMISRFIGEKYFASHTL